MDKETKKEFDELANKMKAGFANTTSKDEFENMAVMINNGFEETNNKIDNVEKSLRKEISEVREEVSEVRDEVAEVRKDLRKTELELKDHTEEKLGDLKGDLVVLMRKEDKKVNALIEILNKNNILKDEDVNKLMQLEPFARAQF